MLTKLEMVCTCRTEGKAAANETMTRAISVIDPDGVGSPRQNASQIVYSLAHEFKSYYHVSSVHADMWMGLVVSGGDEDISVQCDALEDGLAAVWTYLYENGRYDDADS